MFVKPIKKIKKLYFIAFLLLSILGLFSCIDVVNIALEDTQEFLVIDGTLTANKGQHSVKVYYATGQKTAARREVSGVQISLFEEGQKLLDYEEIKPGFYLTPKLEIAPSVGKNYHIEITLADGNRFHSEQEMMPELIKGEKVFFENILKPEDNGNGFFLNRPYVDVYVSTNLPNDKDYWLKWEVQSMYGFPEIQCSPLGPPPEICYILNESNPQIINLFNGANLDLDYLPAFFLADRKLPQIDAEFRNKHYYLVNQKSITSNAYEYWRRVNTISNQQGSVFDAPPAYVPGNVFNVDKPEATVLGYFEVSNVDSLRGFLTAGGLQEFYIFPENLCRPGNPLNLFERACCTCELIPNGTMERPDWW